MGLAVKGFNCKRIKTSRVTIMQWKKDNRYDFKDYWLRIIFLIRNRSHVYLGIIPCLPDIKIVREWDHNHEI